MTLFIYHLLMLPLYTLENVRFWFYLFDILISPALSFHALFLIGEHYDT